MMCWKFYRPERNLISHTVILHNHLIASCLHTHFSPYAKKTEIDGSGNNQTIKSNKMDDFVSTIKLSFVHKKQESLKTFTEELISQKNTPVLTDIIASQSQAKTAPTCQSKKLSEAQQKNLMHMIGSCEFLKSFDLIEEYQMSNYEVPFMFILYFCGVASTSGIVEEVLKIKKLAKKTLPLEYKRFSKLDDHLARALYYSGDIEGALNKLHSLYKRYSPVPNQVNSATKSIISNIMETNNLKNEEMVLKFASDVAENDTVLEPVLELWSASFCSSIYRHQKIAESLLERYPKLLNMLPNKFKNIIDSAYSSADVELLHRIIEFLLLHQFRYLYATATTALLKHQCNIGNVRGIHRVIRFAEVLRIALKPSDVENAMLCISDKQSPPILYEKVRKRHLPPLPKPYSVSDFSYKF